MTDLELFVGSYGHRYSDPMTTFVGFTRESVEDAIDRGIEWELKELFSYCDAEHEDEEDEEACPLCNPDVVSYGVWPVWHVSDLGGLRNTINLIKDARENEDGITYIDT